MSKERNMLTDVEVEEVSFVKKGANNKSVIWKSAEGAENEGEIMVKKQSELEEDKKKKPADDEEEEFDDSEDEEDGEEDNNKGGKKMADEKKKCADVKKEEPAGKTLEEVQKEFTTQMVEMQKSFDDQKKSFDTQMETIKKERDSIKVSLEKELDLRMLKDAEEVAARDYGRLGDAHEIALIMKDAGQHLAPEMYGKLSELLKTANQRIDAGMFTEVGRSDVGEIGGSAADKVRAIAKSYVEKSAGKLTPMEAEARAWADNPELLSQYENDYKGQFR